VYSILEYEMAALNSLSGRESLAIGCFWGCGGALIAAVLGALITFPSDPRKAGVYTAVTAVLALGTVLSGAQWLLAKKERNAMVAAIKARTAHPVTIQPSPR
jgi:hypothetical protein